MRSVTSKVLFENDVCCGGYPREGYRQHSALFRDEPLLRAAIQLRLSAEDSNRFGNVEMTHRKGMSLLRICVLITVTATARV